MVTDSTALNIIRLTMKMTWNKKLGDSKNKSKKRTCSFTSNLPFEDSQSSSPDKNNSEAPDIGDTADSVSIDEDEKKKAAEEYEVQGNKLAEDGKYHEALGKWETAITLMPERSILHEQKAQILLELGDAWNALKAATRATELDPTWAEAWITLGRAHLNFGEPDYAIESFDKALALKLQVVFVLMNDTPESIIVSDYEPDSEEAKDDRRTALNLIKRRKLLHTTGLSSTEGRFLVGERSCHD